MDNNSFTIKLKFKYIIHFYCFHSYYEKKIFIGFHLFIKIPIISIMQVLI